MERFLLRFVRQTLGCFPVGYGYKKHILGVEFGQQVLKNGMGRLLVGFGIRGIFLWSSMTPD